MDTQFKLHTEFEPAGDQPKAIKSLVDGLNDGFLHQTLLGVTGSGKTFTMQILLPKPSVLLSSWRITKP